MKTLAWPQRATRADCSQHPSNAGHQTILVVNDDSYMRAFLRLALEQAGYDVLVAADGDEACRLVQESAEVINLLVTNLEMGAADGRDIAASLQLGRPGLRVLYLSGFPKGDSGQGPLADDLDFLGKPFYPKEFVEKVRMIIERGPGLAKRSIAPS